MAKAIEINVQNGQVTEIEVEDFPIEFQEPILDYNEEVIKAIRQRYSVDDELAIQRKRDSNPIEFQEYFDYCEECKLKFSYLKK